EPFLYDSVLCLGCCGILTWNPDRHRTESHGGPSIAIAEARHRRNRNRPGVAGPAFLLLRGGADSLPVWRRPSGGNHSRPHLRRLRPERLFRTPRRGSVGPSPTACRPLAAPQAVLSPRASVSYAGRDSGPVAFRHHGFRCAAHAAL